MKAQTDGGSAPAPVGPGRQFGDAVLRSVEAVADMAPGQIQQAADQIAGLVRRRPIASVLAAGAAGAVLGLLVRGRHQPRG